MTQQTGKEKELLLEVANPRRAQARWKRIAFWAASCVFFWIIAGTGLVWGLYLAVKDSIPTLPELSQYNPPITTRVYSLSGIPIAEFAIERRDVVPSDKIPRHLVEAFIASDVPAIMKYTRDVLYLDNGQVCEIKRDGYKVEDLDGKPVTLETEGSGLTALTEALESDSPALPYIRIIVLSRADAEKITNQDQ